MYSCIHSVTQSSENHLYWPPAPAADKERISCPTKHNFPVRFTAFLTHSCLCSIQHNFTFWMLGKIKNIFLSPDTKYKEILMCTMSFVLRHKACNTLFIKEHYLLQNSWFPHQGRGSSPQMSYSALPHQNPFLSRLLSCLWVLLQEVSELQAIKT